MTMLYTVIDNQYVCVPLIFIPGATIIDWLHAAPYEPSLLIVPCKKTKPRGYTMRRILMQCDQCGHKNIQCQRGPCHKCREGFMCHSEEVKMRINAR